MRRFDSESGFEHVARLLKVGAIEVFVLFVVTALYFWGINESPSASAAHDARAFILPNVNELRDFLNTNGATSHHSRTLDIFNVQLLIFLVFYFVFLVNFVIAFLPDSNSPITPAKQEITTKKPFAKVFLFVAIFLVFAAIMPIIEIFGCHSSIGEFFQCPGKTAEHFAALATDRATAVLWKNVYQYPGLHMLGFGSIVAIYVIITHNRRVNPKGQG